MGTNVLLCDSIGNARLAGLEADLKMSGGQYALALSESWAHLDLMCKYRRRAVTLIETFSTL